jgi:hypothetical protein
MELSPTEIQICQNLGISREVFAARKANKPDPTRGQERPGLPDRWGDEGPKIPRNRSTPVISADMDDRKAPWQYATRRISALAADEGDGEGSLNGSPDELVQRARGHLDAWGEEPDDDDDRLAKAARCLMHALELTTNPDSPSVDARFSMLRFGK